MTVAGVSGLLMAQMELTAGRENEDPVAICGKYEENPAIQAGMAWINSSFGFQLSSGTYYNIYGIERLGRLTGQRFIGSHDWYREGCAGVAEKPERKRLLEPQRHLGQQRHGQHQFFPPVFVQGPHTGAHQQAGSGTRAAPGKRPGLEPPPQRPSPPCRVQQRKCLSENAVGLEIFDMCREAFNNTPEQIEKMTADLLQSPILYITGHKSPADLKCLSETEKRVLKKYVENGGFILAVACCGSKEFTDGFHELCQELWPNSELTNLEIDHPIWSMQIPGQTGVVRPAGESSRAARRWWSSARKTCAASGKLTVAPGKARLPFTWGEHRRLRHRHGAAAAAAHADARLSSAAKTIRRQPPCAAISRSASSSARPARRPPGNRRREAMPKLTEHLRKKPGPGHRREDGNVPIDHKDLVKFKFLYLHGRNEFTFAARSSRSCVSI